MLSRNEKIRYVIPDKAKGRMSDGSGIIRSLNHNIPSVARDGFVGIKSSVLPGPEFCFPLNPTSDWTSVPVIRRIFSIIATNTGTLIKAK